LTETVPPSRRSSVTLLGAECLKMRSILLWMVGMPIPIILVLLWFGVI
jgi:hypothetical protein